MCQAIKPRRMERGKVYRFTEIFYASRFLHAKCAQPFESLQILSELKRRIAAYSTYIRSTDSMEIVNKNTILAPAAHLRHERKDRLSRVLARISASGKLTERIGGMRFTWNCRGSTSAINFDALIKRSRFEPTHGRTKTQH